MYLTLDLEKKLPMHKRVNVRVIADVHPQQDPYESRGFAVRAVALGRLM